MIIYGIALGCMNLLFYCALKDHPRLGLAVRRSRPLPERKSTLSYRRVAVFDYGMLWPRLVLTKFASVFLIRPSALMSSRKFALVTG